MTWKASQHLLSLWYSVDALHLSLQPLLCSVLSLSAREVLGILGIVCSSFLSSLLSCSPHCPPFLFSSPYTLFTYLPLLLDEPFLFSLLPSLLPSILSIYIYILSSPGLISLLTHQVLVPTVSGSDYRHWSPVAVLRCRQQTYLTYNYSAVFFICCIWFSAPSVLGNDKIHLQTYIQMSKASTHIQSVRWTHCHPHYFVKVVNTWEIDLKWFIWSPSVSSSTVSFALRVIEFGRGAGTVLCMISTWAHCTFVLISSSLKLWPWARNIIGKHKDGISEEAEIIDNGKPPKYIVFCFCKDNCPWSI